MKNILIISFILALSATFVYTEKDCLTHDIYLKVKEYLNGIKDSVQESDKDLINNLISKYEANTPAIVDADALGVCNQFASQKSCCNKDITSIIDQLGQIRVRNIAKSGNGKKGDIFFRIASVIKNLMKRSNCSAKAKSASTSEETIEQTATDSDKGKVLKEKIQLGQIKLNKALSGLTRGAICAICAGVDKIDTYLVDGQIQITEASSKSFKEVADAALDAINSASDPTSTEFKEAITAILTSLTDDTKCQDFAKQRIEQILSKAARADKSKCKSTQLLPASGTEGECEKTSKGPDDLESSSESDATRLLATSDDAAINANGINVYITSSLDDNLAADGSLSSSSNLLKFAGAVILSIFFAF